MKTIIASLLLIGNVAIAAESKTANKVYLDHEFKRLTQKQAAEFCIEHSINFKITDKTVTVWV